MHIYLWGQEKKVDRAQRQGVTINRYPQDKTVRVAPEVGPSRNRPILTLADTLQSKAMPQTVIGEPPPFIAQQRLAWRTRLSNYP